MSTASSSSSSANNKKILWFWQSNPNHSDKKDQKQWKRYSDYENDIIEKAYKKKETEAHFGDNVINFQLHKHYKKNDINTQRSVKREEVDLSQYAREERFCSSEEVVSTSLERIDNEKNFINQWKNEIGQDVYTNYPVVAELAAQGMRLFHFLLRRYHHVVYFPCRNHGRRKTTTQRIQCTNNGYGTL
jgi:hypothetical protein